MINECGIDHLTEGADTNSAKRGTGLQVRRTENRARATSKECGEVGQNTRGKDIWTRSMKEIQNKTDESTNGGRAVQGLRKPPFFREPVCEDVIST